MNNRKVAFILCVNNLEQYSEAKRYIDRLNVPEGFETDVLAVQEAPSMCEGYNAGMEATDAKYKVYMHQDVCIINKDFITDMLKIFEDEKVGLIGMVGARKIPDNAYAVSSWDTGKVYYNGVDYKVDGYAKPGEICTEVEAIDGLLFITQYDVKFREDVFTEFDFYDISASFEYRRAGYKVVVPNQIEPWVYHNDKLCKMSQYDANRKKFIDEYKEDFNLDDNFEIVYNTRYEDFIRQYRKAFEDMVDAGKMEEVSKEILEKGTQYSGFKDLVLLAMIYVKEKEVYAFDWNGGIDELYQRLDDLKSFLKRVEFGIEMDDEEYRYFCMNYSIYSIVMVASIHCLKSRTVVSKLAKYIEDKESINAVVTVMSDEMSRLAEIDSASNVKAYNFGNVGKDTNIIVCIGDANDSAEVNKLFEIVDESKLSERIIVFARQEGKLIEEIKSKDIPILIGEPIKMKVYFMEIDWNIEKAFYIGKGSYVEELKRLLTKTSIELKDLNEV